MANHFSALKRFKQIKSRTIVNRNRKTRLRRQVRELRRKMEAADTEGAQAILPQTFSIIDRAAKWGIIKANAAARYKSRLHSNLKKLSAA
jgi:small subunit ribosomal protein S20